MEKGQTSKQDEFDSRKFVILQLIFCIFFAPISLFLFEFLSMSFSGNLLFDNNFYWALAMMFTYGLPVTILVLFFATIFVVSLRKLAIWKVITICLIICTILSLFFSPNMIVSGEFPAMLIIAMLFTICTYYLTKYSTKYLHI